mgnify:CR=1 FL=1
MSDQQEKRNKLEQWLDKHNPYYGNAQDVDRDPGADTPNLYFNEYYKIISPPLISYHHNCQI